MLLVVDLLPGCSVRSMSIFFTIWNGTVCTHKIKNPGIGGGGWGQEICVWTYGIDGAYHVRARFRYLAIDCNMK